MTLIIGLAVLTLILGTVGVTFDSDFALGTGMFTGILLLIALITLPFSYYSGLADIERYHALKESVEYSRTGDVSEYERAAITTKIAEYNQDLASVKYWNDTIFDIYIPDELAELEPLK